MCVSGHGLGKILTEDNVENAIPQACSVYRWRFRLRICLLVLDEILGRVNTGKQDVVNSMPEYIDPAVSELRESNSDTEVTLLLGVSGEQDEFAEQVEATGATVETTLGRATLRVTAPESAVDELCELSGLKSIEIERDDVRKLDEGTEISSSD